jgi:hypothetical protein
MVMMMEHSLSRPYTTSSLLVKPEKPTVYLKKERGKTYRSYKKLHIIEIGGSGNRCPCLELIVLKVNFEHT